MKFTKTGMANIDALEFSNNDQGNINLNQYYKEHHNPAASNGDLTISHNGQQKITNHINANRINNNIAGRLLQRTILPTQGMQFKRRNTHIATLSNNNNFYIKGNIESTIPNPSTNGPYTGIINNIVYARAGLNYIHPALGTEYDIFETPTANYQTGSVDLSDFSDLAHPVLWPFNSSHMPINGILRVPQAPGPLPLVLFVHGNHDPRQNSTPGYIYLCDLLASHGMITATIDENFLNGNIQGEVGARAMLLLEHIRQFRTWNNTPAHPLQNKVDLDNVMIVGHSRGGDAVAVAPYFNVRDYVAPDLQTPAININNPGTLGPYHFGIKSVLALAPTDVYQPVQDHYSQGQQPVKVTNNYVVIHGSKDKDVTDFSGYKTYDRAQPIDFNAPLADSLGLKSLLWIYGANHNYFNTAWGADGNIPSYTLDPSYAAIPAANQRRIAEVYVSGLAQALLLGRSQYLEMLKDHRFVTQAPNQWLIDNTINLISQYHDPHRHYIQHFENVGPLQLAAPLNGTIDATHMQGRKFFFNLGSLSRLYQATGGLRAEWANNTDYYQIDFVALNIDDLQYLCFRIGQSDEAANPINANQDLSIELYDGTNRHSERISNYTTLHYPDTQGYTNFQRKVVMSTVRIPLQLFTNNGIDINSIQQLKFLFNRINTGVVYIDDIQLSY